MSVNLHFAKKREEWSDNWFSARNFKNVFYCIVIELYESGWSCDNTDYIDENTMQYEVSREDLKRVMYSIHNEDETYQKNRATINAFLDSAEINKNEFTHILRCLVDESDQTCSHILISWF